MWKGGSGEIGECEGEICGRGGVKLMEIDVILRWG